MNTDIFEAFRRLLPPCIWEKDDKQTKALELLCAYAEEHGFSPSACFDDIYIEAVNNKLGLNEKCYKHILDVAFEENITLNHLLKARIKAFLDSEDKGGYISFLTANGIKTEGMEKAFMPVSREETYLAAESLIKTDERYTDVLLGVFSRFCFNLFPKKCTYSFFSGVENMPEDFFEYLGSLYPDMVKRDNALGIIDVPESLFAGGYDYGCNIVLNEIRKMYKTLNNHCDLVIYIPPITSCGEDLRWKLYADCVLYAEKHKKERIDKPYFRHGKIAQKTLEYIEGLAPSCAELDYAFEGFAYKDCFVLESSAGEYSLLLVLEKNVRDERPVPCPACRTGNIKGNSYPVLNVKSWECDNPLCPDRSKYNRGKRYAYVSLLRQRQMLGDKNAIPAESIFKWHLDCVKASKEDAFKMALLHYSCAGDGVCFVSESEGVLKAEGREARHEHFLPAPGRNLLADFKSSSYFYRYLKINDKKPKPAVSCTIGKAAVYNADAQDALRGFPDNFFGGAVTSPPYYNAKPYSQWPNIYCYLYDMYNINAEVFRTLKKGGVYLYNIFDTFDNENTVALSAMGEKRMILGAYMIDIFERTGFRILGNIIWNKGEIQGNRRFNQGNLTPYYQAPLNCWEHIFILSKGQPDKKFASLVSKVEDMRPVMKIVRGKNVLGHDAPYPKEIPSLLLKCMSEGDLILDPFLGSGTTCAVANGYGVRSVGIEKDGRYYELCKRLIRKDGLPNK